MTGELFTPLQRLSSNAKRVMLLAGICGMAYLVSVLQQPFSLLDLYQGCMVEMAERVVLPANLILFCMGCARFGVFERVRRNPADEFRLNAAWSLFVSVAVSLTVWAVFVIANVLKESLTDPRQWTLCAIMLAQLFMMNMSVTLAVWLLMNMGMDWGQVLPPIIVVFIIADFCLKPMAGDLTRYAFYFWYPIGDSWRTVFIQQAVPFLGYCMLMIMANVVAFGRSDRLRLT